MSSTVVAISVSGSCTRRTAGYVTLVADYMLGHVESGLERVELDLTDVTAVDEDGFASLVQVAASATAGGAAVVVRYGAERTMLERHHTGRLMASEQIGRMLRTHLRPATRRRRAHPVVADARVVRSCSASLAGQHRG
ncbi:hypothetical protein QTQ03_03165 [Micromonospora sp. WMMA1363]|uniref:hypothetical protein n=1 Tax=Micromonospora sp. WMMA1363 TaxID=3053985 RepID=UPI00259CA355|nr:hypothetical protein [Micromonospora sp. WMMA1363]MDM4718639.1 hypothetical protein [Micromonospora sp. WMMA1363]